MRLSFSIFHTGYFLSKVTFLLISYAAGFSFSDVKHKIVEKTGKAAVPYFPADAQRVFALYAKMMELSHTIAMFSGGPAELMMMSEESGTSQPLDILQQLRTYAGESQKEMIDQILFAFHALEILQMPQEPADPLG